MKNNKKLILIFSTIFLFVGLFWSMFIRLQHKKSIMKSVHSVSNLSVRTLKKKSLNKILKSNSFKILIYFQPDCDHCQREATSIQEKAYLFRYAQIVWLSTAPLQDLQKFSTYYKFDMLSNIHFAHISDDTAYYRFGFLSVPDIIIYYPDGSLVRRFKGEISPAILARYIYSD